MCLRAKQYVKPFVAITVFVLVTRMGVKFQTSQQLKLRYLNRKSEKGNLESLCCKFLFAFGIVSMLLVQRQISLTLVTTVIFTNQTQRCVTAII